MYLLGSVETQCISISVWHIIDIIGNSLALIIMLYNAITFKLFKIVYIFHIWSIVLTCAFLAYDSGTDGDGFIQTISILRGIRLLFPLFIVSNAQEIFFTFMILIKKVTKLSAVILLFSVIFSLISVQLYASALSSRCRVNSLP